MKRTVVASLLLVLIFVTAAVTFSSAQNAIEKTCQALEACTEKEKNENLDALKTRDALKTWENNKKILFALMFHDDFSDIENNMTELEYCLKNSDFDESVKICAETSAMLVKLRDELGVSFENIF